MFMNFLKQKVLLKTLLNNKINEFKNENQYND
jgi:hypothetical protein